MPTLTEWLSVVQTAVIVLTACVAIYGIDAWRREFVGKRRMELAEDVLGMFYQARDVIAAIRSPMGFVGEGSTRKRAPGERPEHSEALDHAFSLIERYQRNADLFSRIHASRYRFMAQFGAAEVKPFDDLHAVVTDLMLASHRMSRRIVNPPRPRNAEQEARQEAEDMQIHSVFYSGGESDPIAPRVDAAVGEIERVCRHAIEAPGSLSWWLHRSV